MASLTYSGCPPHQNPRLRPRGHRHSIAQELHQHVFDRGGPVPRRTNKLFTLCRQFYLQAAPADAAVLATFHSAHLPDPSLHGLPSHPDSQATATPCTDFTCTWCHSEVTPPEVFYSARNLPWPQIIHRLLLCNVWPKSPSLFPNSVLKCCCWPLTGLFMPAALRSFLPIDRSPPLSGILLRALLSALPFSVRLLTPLGFRTRLRVSQSTQGLAAGWISLQQQPVSDAVCALLIPP
jgi:hypothetical protein